MRLAGTLLLLCRNEKDVYRTRIHIQRLAMCHMPLMSEAIWSVWLSDKNSGPVLLPHPPTYCFIPGPALANLVPQARLKFAPPPPPHARTPLHPMPTFPTGSTSL